MVKRSTFLFFHWNRKDNIDDPATISSLAFTSETKMSSDSLFPHHTHFAPPYPSQHGQKCFNSADRQKFVAPQSKTLKKTISFGISNQWSCLGNYLKNLQICMLKQCFKIRQTLAIFTKFQIIFSKEELKIFTLLTAQKYRVSVKQIFALGHSVIKTLLSPVVKSILHTK